LNYLPQGLDVVGTISSPCEIGQVKLNLIPSFIQSHWHSANERLYTGGTLIVGGSESTTNILVIEYLYLEREVFLQVLNNHDKEGQFDGKGLLVVARAGDEVG